MEIAVSSSARKFMKERGIQNVIFDLKIIEPARCSIGIVKEIEPCYEPVKNKAKYFCLQVEGRRVFISKELRILGPLTLATEGFWKMKRLALIGATVPL